MQPQIDIQRRYPREDRTPTDEAFYIIAHIDEYFHEKLPEMPDGAFGEGLLNPAVAAIFPAGDRLMQDLKVEFDERPEEAAQMAGMYMMALAVNFAMDAIRAEKSGRLNLAWTMIADAQYWRGHVVSEPGESVKKEGVAENAKKAARARHQKNHAHRQDLFKWCDENFAKFDGNVAAASRAAEKVIPMELRTLQLWIGMYLDMKGLR